MAEILTLIDTVVWGPAMIVFLLGSHIFLTVRTGFTQRKLPLAIKMSLKGSDGEGDISPFDALATPWLPLSAPAPSWAFPPPS